MVWLNAGMACSWRVVYFIYVYHRAGAGRLRRCETGVVVVCGVIQHAGRWWVYQTLHQDHAPIDTAASAISTNRARAA